MELLRGELPPDELPAAHGPAAWAAELPESMTEAMTADTIEGLLPHGQWAQCERTCWHTAHAADAGLCHCAWLPYEGTQAPVWTTDPA